MTNFWKEKSPSTTSRRIFQPVPWTPRSISASSTSIGLSSQIQSSVIHGKPSRLECGRSREEIVRHLVALLDESRDIVVGFDFAFAVPEWYFGERGIKSPHELWQMVATEALTPSMRELGLMGWVQVPEWPFWRTGKPADLQQAARAFRRTEIEMARPGTQPKSVFQLVGAGQVRPGSLYGMQALDTLACRWCSKSSPGR
jgi:hypothetical protein